MYKREQGQSLVEFALSLGLLILIMLGIFDLGRVYNASMVITNAAREGAYYGAMHPDNEDGGIEANATREALAGGIALTGVDWHTSGGAMIVTVHCDFSLFSSILPVVSPIHLQRSAQMVIY